MPQVRVEGDIQRAAVHLLAQYWRGLLLSCWIFLILHEPEELTLVLLSPSKTLQLPRRADEWPAKLGVLGVLLVLLTLRGCPAQFSVK